MKIGILPIKYKDTIVGIMFGIFIVSWWAITTVTITRLEEYSPIVVFRAGSIVAVSVGVCVAVWVHYSNILWRRSEAYLEKCEEFLEKAYITFTKKNDSLNRPPNNRMVWLNTARLLQTSIDLSMKITDQSHRESYIEIEQYWRGLFYDLLITNQDAFPESYFSASAEKFIIHGLDDQEPLAELSLVSIYKFVRWPEHANDPLLKLSKFSDSEIKILNTYGPRSLAKLMNKVNNIRRKQP